MSSFRLPYYRVRFSRHRFTHKLVQFFLHFIIFLQRPCLSLVFSTFSVSQLYISWFSLFLDSSMYQFPATSDCLTCLRFSQRYMHLFHPTFPVRVRTLFVLLVPFLLHALMTHPPFLCSLLISIDFSQYLPQKSLTSFSCCSSCRFSSFSCLLRSFFS